VCTRLIGVVGTAAAAYGIGTDVLDFAKAHSCLNSLFAFRRTKAGFFHADKKSYIMTLDAMLWE